MSDPDVFSRKWQKSPVRPKIPSKPIHPAVFASTAARAAVEKETSILRPYVNGALNSRLAQMLGSIRPFVLNWVAELSQARWSYWILWAADRIAVPGPEAWQLFDLEGHRIGFGPSGGGGLTLDPEKHLFYVGEHSGLIGARNLKDGNRAFAMSLYSGNKFDRIFMTRMGSRFISVSTQVRTDPDLPDPQDSLLEITELRDPDLRKSYTDQGGPVEIADLERQSKLLLAAIHENTIVLATRDRIFFADSSGELNGALAGTFVPYTMSLDEMGRIYLILEPKESNRTQSLWVLSPDGELLCNYSLPEGYTVKHPPIIGYDHSVYLLAGEKIIAVASDGNTRWSRSTGRQLSGAVVTADNQLFVSEGNELVAYNLKGERRVVHLFEEQLVTAPVIIDGNRILVASDHRLFCLKPQ
ncbi:MAG: PQQ-binding-like beta-propeller repeat protein [Planctomycetota bacterium]